MRFRVMAIGHTVLMFAFLSGVAHAQGFDGTWKVPDSQTFAPRKCEAGDVKECLKLAWSAEAGIRVAGGDDLARLRHALKYHELACKHAGRATCSNSRRVGAKIAAFRKLKKPGERIAFWCGDALRSAGLFAENSKTAGTVVQAACLRIFPTVLRDTIGYSVGESAENKLLIVLMSAHQSICPKLRTKPKLCGNKRVGKTPKSERATALAQIIAAYLGEKQPDLRAHADELATWLSR